MTFCLLCMSFMGVYAQHPHDGGFPNIPTTIEIQRVKPVLDTVSSTRAHRIFRVEVSFNARYNLKFWIIPSKSDSQYYSTYDVEVDGSSIGSLVAVKGNWQYLTTEHEGVNLTRGMHEIKVSCPLPEVPEVENVSVFWDGVVHMDDIIRADTLRYSEFYQRAVARFCLPHESYGNVMGATDISLPDMPSYYTFFKKYYFEQGQTVTFSTISTDKHVIDLFSCAAAPNISVACEFSKIKVSSFSINNHQYQVGNLSATIPVSGFYMIRLRSYDIGQMSCCTLTYNNTHVYESVPITYSSADVSLPVGCDRMVVTAAGNITRSDPMLFVEGGGSQPGKVKYYNDDTPLTFLNNTLLSSNDAGLVCSDILVSPTSVSWSNYSSVSPTDTCSIIIHYGEDTFDSKKTYDWAAFEENDGEIEKIYPQEYNKTATISVFDMNGLLRRTETASVTDVNAVIRRSGIRGAFCIVRVSTLEGTKTKKVNLKSVY